MQNYSPQDRNKFRQIQIFWWINFEGSWGRLQNWFNTKKNDLFYFIFTNLNLHNPLTPYFVLILLKGSNINQHMWSLTVIFGPIMFQKCWFLFFTSCSNFAIAQSSIGQITKSWTFLKSTLNGLWKNVQPLLSRPSECREIKNQKA